MLHGILSIKWFAENAITYNSIFCDEGLVIYHTHTHTHTHTVSSSSSRTFKLVSCYNVNLQKKIKSGFQIVVLVPRFR